MLITFIMNIVGSFTLSVSIAIAFSCLYIKLGPIFYAKKDNERKLLEYQPICLIPDCQHQLVHQPFYNPITIDTERPRKIYSKVIGLIGIRYKYFALVELFLRHQIQ